MKGDFLPKSGSSEACRQVGLIIDTLTSPNSIAFFPNEKPFLVANSDRQRPIWCAFAIDENGKVSNRRIFTVLEATTGPGKAEWTAKNR
jgi:sugar lactone lactonase YvrE